MKYKRSMIIIMFAVFLFAIATASASDVSDTTIVSGDITQSELAANDEIIEDNLQTDENNILAQANNEKTSSAQTDSEKLSAGEGTYYDLRDDIGNGGDKNLTKSYYRYTGGATIIITNSGVINGNGAVIDMAGSDIRAFDVTASGVTIKNLTIKNVNNTVGFGGAIYFDENSNGRIINCNFTNNSAYYGGAIEFYGTGSVENCNFIDNNAIRYGGAVFFSSSGSVTNCNFIGNKATDVKSYGGAVFFLKKSDVTNCNFIGNKATGDASQGGAVCFFQNSEGNVKNCSFTNNSATGNGGAIYFDENSNGRIINCNFTNNKATGDYCEGGAVYFLSNGTVTNCNFINNTATNWGGAVYIYHNSNVTNCNFTNNKATGDDGFAGAVYLGHESTVTNCSFTNNSASDGGGIYFDFQGTTHEVRNCNFTDNKASVEGGAIRFGGGGNVRNCNFVDNKVTSFDGGAIYFRNYGTVENCNFINNIASRIAGAVDFEDTGTVTNCNFVDNKVTSFDGGAICFRNYGTVENCNFTNNTAVYGGAICFSNSGTVENCNFTGNNASFGSAIYFYSTTSTNTVSNSCFLNNRADAKNFEVTKNDNNIIIIFNGEDNLLNAIYSQTDVDVAFTNVTYWSANGISNTDSSTPARSNREAGQNITLEIFDSDDKLVENVTLVTDINGQAIYDLAKLSKGKYRYNAYHFEDSYYTYAESNGTFTNGLGDINILQRYINEAAADSVLTLNRSYTFTVGMDENLADGIVIDKPLTINGNGYTINALNKARIFMVTANNVVLNNITFTNANALDDEGGAVLFYHVEGNVINCSFNNNSAYKGGAILFDSGSSGRMVNCNFTDNTAGNSGGAVYFRVDNCEVTKCNFANNTAGISGGAINMLTGSVKNCNFTNNSGGIYGGAIEMISGSVENCNFTNNSAEYGGAIYTEWGSIEDCNFTDNNATTGSAIYFYSVSDTKTVSNSIFLNNRANAETLEVTKNENNITITFTGNNNLLNAIQSRDDSEVTFTNVTYWSANGISNTGNSATKPLRSNKEAGQNITVGVVVNGEIVLEGVKVTDENGMIVLDIIAGENYYITARHDTDSYYTEAEKTISTMKFNVNVTSQTTNNKTVNITAKSNIPNEIIDGKLIFIVPNSNPINATYAANGTWWAVHTFDDVGNYGVNASYIGLDDVTINNATIRIMYDTRIDVNNKTLDLLIDDEFTIVATTTPEGLNVSYVPDDSGVYSVDENGKVTALRDGDGSILLKVGGYGTYAENSTVVNVTVRKVPTEITVLNDTLALEISDEIAAGVTLTPADAGNVTYSISNSSVVKVEDSKIIALTEGKTIITVSFEGNKKYLAAENKTINVTVSKIPTNISVDPVSLDLFVGDETVIVASLTPADAGNVTFTSSDDDIVLVEDDGNVIANGKGQAVITVSFAGDEKYASSNRTINVTVRLNNASVTVDNDTLDLKVDETYAINATKHPDTILLDINYTSSNSAVATVDKNGIVTAVGEGTAVITVSVGDGEIYAENSTDVTVTVSKVPTEITVLNDTLVLAVSDEIAAGVTLTPANAGNVTYSISNSSVVKVEDSKIIALTEGKTTITVSFEGNKKYLAAENKTISVTVKLNDARIIAEDMTLDVYTNATVSPVTIPSGLEVEYASGNVTIAEVDVNGVVIAHNAGNTTITITTKADGIHAVNSTTINVSVNKINSTIDVNDTVLNYGETTRVNVTTDGALGITAELNGEKIIFSGNNIPIPVLNAGTYNLTVTTIPDENHKAVSKTVTVTVLKQNATFDIKMPASITFGEKSTVNVRLPDDATGNVAVKVDGKVVANATVTNGAANFVISSLKAGTHTIEAIYSGDGNYNPVNKTANVTVKKATPKITAKAKTFKDTDKNKKYTVTLKDNNGNAIKNADVALKVNGKTYTAKTNSKGVATFYLKKLTRTGKFKAAITFKGNSNYNKATKKVKITVKATWKTICKGSKNHAMVKKIQKALKKNGYYLTYKGHYLKVDGIFHDCTERSVKEFQKANGLKVTGKVDYKTAQKLKLVK